jgi:pimeloyl-ACP methyl ester carboxylesterase
MGPIELSFDITADLSADVTEGRQILISAWLFFPDDISLLGERPVTMSLTAGGSYDKRYHHLEIPGHPGYSAAEHLAGLGNIVILTDHLGVGGSTRVPDQKKTTRYVVAQANHAALQQFYARLASGDLHPDLPAYGDFIRIGGGHSMGAMMTTIQQGTHKTWDAIMFLGYTVQGVHGFANGKHFRMADLLPQGGERPDYTEIDRSTQRDNFHFGDVPEAVMQADDAIAVPTPSQIGMVSIERDIITADAAKIAVPVLFGNGERDVSPDPRAEAGYFPLCSDFTLYLLPGSAHCHTFANTRHQFWDRMHAWSRSLGL